MIWKIILIYLDISMIMQSVKDKNIVLGIISVFLTLYIFSEFLDYKKQIELKNLFKKEKLYTGSELIIKSIPILSNDKKNIELLFNIPARNEQIYLTSLEGFIKDLPLKHQQRLLYKLDKYCKRNEKNNTLKVNIILKGIKLYKEKNWTTI